MLHYKLMGEYRHSLDSKNRLSVPAKLREQFGDTVVITRALRGAVLRIYSQAEWELFEKSVFEREDKPKEKVVERYRRFIYKGTEEISFDSQGRVLLNPILLKHAELNNVDAKDVVIVGCGKYAEIWLEKNYEAEEAREEEDMDEFLEELEGYDY